jgi:hypothetical protein
MSCTALRRTSSGATLGVVRNHDQPLSSAHSDSYSQSESHPQRDPQLRLTRRGRWVIAVTLAGGAFAGSLATGGVGRADEHAVRLPVERIQVAPGETLWSIAAQSMPGVERREAVRQLIELNALPGGGVMAGQEIAVPARSSP